MNLLVVQILEAKFFRREMADIKLFFNSMFTTNLFNNISELVKTYRPNPRRSLFLESKLLRSKTYRKRRTFIETKYIGRETLAKVYKIRSREGHPVISMGRPGHSGHRGIMVQWLYLQI